MTAPTPNLTKLDEARDRLHAALDEVMTALGWADRTDRLPPRQIVAPFGWVDAPTLSNAAQANVPAGSIVATFPVCVSVDGLPREQVALLDRLLAYGWQQLDAVERARVITAGPQFLELPSGAETRAVVFSVQVTLQARTLCSGTLTQSHEAPPAP